MHPISSRDENDSLSSTEEVSQVSARTSRHEFSRVAAGTRGTFSSYDGDAHSKREFV